MTDPETWQPRPRLTEMQARAKRFVERCRRRGQTLSPVTGQRRRRLGSTFWGRAWMARADSISSWSSRLERGKTYLRNQLVVHLEVGPRRVDAIVYGADAYDVRLDLAEIPSVRWDRLVEAVRGRVSTELELLRGRLDDATLAVLVDRERGLLPTVREVETRCSCPDPVDFCKHVAAAIHGVGVRLDERPELFFDLRGVDRFELLGPRGFSVESLVGKAADGAIEADDEALGAMFGIELASEAPGEDAVAALPGRLPKEITPAQLLAWGVPRSTFQNWVGGEHLTKTGRRGVYGRTGSTRRKVVETRRRLGLD